MKRFSVVFFLGLLIIGSFGYCGDEYQGWKVYKYAPLHLMVKCPKEWKVDLRVMDKYEMGSVPTACEFGFLRYKNLKIELTYYIKEPLENFVNKYLDNYEKVYSKEISQVNNKKIIRLRTYSSMCDEDRYNVVQFQEVGDKIIMAEGYLWSEKSLLNKDKNYEVMVKIMNSIQEY